ncbi:MAG: neutral/alkaline non-lysosomal ceramidase N-terminal domain-containing protein [Fimbriiglobus sp.]|jgi:hypothetical protein|nr:neutral/alkaline non-lysosomal ceramidase N-terminal domain-containing protein [Fimbriiglobus sp.]
MRASFAAFLACLLCALAPAADPTLSVGFAEEDVSPKVGGKTPVYIAGFGNNRVATKLHDPIMARAVVLSDGTKKIAWVSVDVVGLFLPTVEKVRAKVKGFDYVMVSSTHNHEGPDTLGLWGKSNFTSGVDPEYLTAVVDGCVKAITAAEKKLTAATARIGTAAGPELLRDSRQPEVKHDTMVTILFDGPDGPLGLLVQWNVHPELLDSKNTEVSADHVGYTVRHLKEKYKCPVAYFTGTVGGLMTNLGVPLKDDKGNELKDGTFEKTEKYGIEVGKLAEKAVAARQAVTLTPFEVRTQTLLAPVDNNLYKLAWGAGVLSRSMYLWDGHPTPKEFKEAKDPSKPVGVKTEVGYLKLGELDVACIPGEIYPELVLDQIQDPADKGADFPDAAKEPGIYPQMKGKYKMLFGLANDEIGYILPKRQWDEKAPFCYGLKKAQYGEINSCGPDVAKVICEAFKQLATK